MFRQMTVTNFHGESLTMELEHPEKSGFLISYIDGITPGSATINIMDINTIDGGIYNSSRFGVRSITIGLIFLGEPGIEDSRYKCYKYFPVKRLVTLRFKTDKRDLMISGYVETHDVNIFTDQEGAVITVSCPDPFFKSTIGQEFKYDYVDAAFEFPFSNESLTAPLLEFGNYSSSITKYMNYEGDYNTGIVITLEFNEYTFVPGKPGSIIGALEGLKAVQGIEIQNISASQYGDKDDYMMRLDIGRLRHETGSHIDPEPGSRIVIDTRRGRKSITYIGVGGSMRKNITNILMDRDFEWLYLIPGENIFVTNVYSLDSDIKESQDKCVDVTISSDILYGGV